MGRKAIKLRAETRTTSGGGYEYYYDEIEVDMQEWAFSPPKYETSHTIGGIVPTDKFIDITFPELDLWTESPYKNISYKVKISYNAGATDWLRVNSPHLHPLGFHPNNLRGARLNLDFSPIGNLSAGLYTANLIFEAYGVDTENGTEHFIESRSVEVKLKITGSSAQNSVPTDKETYNLRYNKATKTLSGDTTILVFTASARLQEGLPFHLYTKKSVSQDGLTQIEIDYMQENDDEYDEAYYLNDKPLGNYSERVQVYAGGIGKYITLNIEVFDNQQDFSLSAQEFDFVLMKDPSETKSETIQIINPNHLNISVLASPSFLSNVDIVGNQLTFSTRPSSDLGVGNYDGEIVLQSGNVQRKIRVKIKVLQAIQSDFKNADFFFALDKNKISMQRTNPNAEYVKMQLTMFFNGFGESHQETQSYDFPYFEETIDLYPGEEINDFFIKCKNLDTQNPSLNYRLASVHIRLTEHDENDTQLTEFHIRNLLFAPGRKPKCYPFLTDFGVRSTMEHSKIRLNMDILGRKKEFSQLNALYKNPPTELPTKAEVHSFLYQRADFQDNLEKNIIEIGELKWIPLPNVKNPVHIFWENQNLVFDWLTLSARHEQTAEYEHLTNADDETSGKFGTKKTKTLTLNTGWLLREEIEVIDDLLASRLCFINIGEKTIKAYPITKKNALWNSDEYLFQMDVEFRVADN